MDIRQIAVLADNFVTKCRSCRHGDEKGRCFFNAGPPQASELLAAVVGAAQHRPTSRNFAARLAASGMLSQRPEIASSSWHETWQGLNEACHEYDEVVV